MKAFQNNSLPYSSGLRFPLSSLPFTHITSQKHAKSITSQNYIDNDRRISSGDICTALPVHPSACKLDPCSSTFTGSTKPTSKENIEKPIRQPYRTAIKRQVKSGAALRASGNPVELYTLDVTTCYPIFKRHYVAC